MSKTLKKIRIGVVMDPISTIHYKKDTSLALLLEAQRRGHELFYMEQHDLFITAGIAQARMRRLRVHENPTHWFDEGEATTQALHALDVILMRKDPPFDVEYIYTTYVLELAEARGCLVVNKPQSLRDINEKAAIFWFPQCTPPSLLTRSKTQLREFLEHHRQIVLKPLHSMGGNSVFRVNAGEPNVNVIIETLTHQEQTYILAQQFIEQISAGDKRVFLINGEPIPYLLARIPAADDFRGNLDAGARTEVLPLGERERWISAQLKPTLQAKGILFAGIDIIGDYLTEINVTSPTGVRLIEAAVDVNICGQLLDCIEGKLK